MKIPNTKHLPSPKRLAFAEALAQAGFAQAGQITNKLPCLPVGRNDENSKFKTKSFWSFEIGI
jgi:hypothetical protein